ncbi:tRNA dihydrouridine synthase DusB [Oleiphilus sp. HI0081]|nr:tRNA dihydrouridine synthase DusB [Oleiphilus sp. HI0043]KZY43129.1 tRNA dihydrouridine synthase DusB [Oleiphilus sp. HI0050]KZY59069.1 tRNA dihydrouridine synthase DusB [Oleiphilus sp. HI0061]KZY75590.1 tRNA dihydrouridine synthase DusB [Oleiphilus sp. HI0068]KZY79946.1 tRNA dihydrouridine synthase DusB [Oleiphilus sp. HI0069]KZY88470.1 tRNA dihydrouridine synthase DusB [Oleiphilus sp. HI0072]KZZ19368.1 tRNA dihydrouridine synthase DusB [Oleiphilus sp. HI0081]KZZ36304.1 tRNA dihydrouridi
MAGVTDRPFRQLCRNNGAAMAVSEMVIADPSFWKTRKSMHRLDHTGESDPISVQIAGGDPEMLATAAELNQERGAQIIDINMGCPAKKVCNKAAGSALMRDEDLVKEILSAVVGAVDIPVTLKIRTGWDKNSRNALTIAKMAEQSGIAALAIHGRTRACAYQGQAEYDTIAQVKEAISIPVLANGDIDSPEKAEQVLKQTGVDGLLIGRAAQGCPWIFDDINHYLKHGTKREERPLATVRDIILHHLEELHQFYGEKMGHRIARKHVGWYLKARPNHQEFRQFFNKIETPEAQLEAVRTEFEKQINNQINNGEIAA